MTPSVHIVSDIFNASCSRSTKDNIMLLSRDVGTMRVVISMISRSCLLFCRIRMLINPDTSHVMKPMTLLTIPNIIYLTKLAS